jgi:hypothetical protein
MNTLPNDLLLLIFPLLLHSDQLQLSLSSKYLYSIYLQLHLHLHYSRHTQSSLFKHFSFPTTLQRLIIHNTHPSFSRKFYNFHRKRQLIPQHLHIFIQLDHNLFLHYHNHHLSKARKYKQCPYIFLLPEEIHTHHYSKYNLKWIQDT